MPARIDHAADRSHVAPHVHQRARQPRPPAREAPPLPTATGALEQLLTDPRLTRRGNSVVRQAAIQRLQQTRGNRATIRIVGHARELLSRGAPPLLDAAQAPARQEGRGGALIPVQPVRAYRVEQLNAKVKIGKDNKITAIESGDGYGINISFVDDDHALDYLKSKGKGYVLLEFDMDDSLWAIIQKRQRGEKTGKPVYDKLKEPEPTTDPHAKNKDRALAFNDAWIEHLSTAARGSRVNITTYEDYISSTTKKKEKKPHPQQTQMPQGGQIRIWSERHQMLIPEGMTEEDFD